MNVFIFLPAYMYHFVNRYYGAMYSSRLVSRLFIFIVNESIGTDSNPSFFKANFKYGFSEL